jgi:two-component system LytT family sensor kinase
MKVSLKHIGGQVLLWLAVWGTMAFLLGGAENFVFGLERSLPMVVGQLMLVYFNLGYLMPRLFERKHYLFYILGALFSVALITFIYVEVLPELMGIGSHPSMKRRKIRSGSHYWPWLLRAFPFLLALVISGLYRLAQLSNQREKEAIELQKEKLETEMKFLKSQTNPHFLFNALHNIYSLSLVQSERTPEYLLKLSGLLRYMLYEGSAPRVSLEKELEYIQNFIDLAMLKDSQGLNVEVDLDRSRPALPIAPMLLIPFVENAFKHSKVEDRKRGWIKIGLTTTEGGLLFNVSNSLPASTYTKDQVGGIGLKNIQRQLELLYPGQYELEIQRSDEAFEVNLKLDLT